MSILLKSATFIAVLPIALFIILVYSPCYYAWCWFSLLSVRKTAGRGEARNPQAPASQGDEAAGQSGTIPLTILSS